ncbi:MAG: UDP-N-acetylglucosamine--N-acetylmuramyl-(pentapeptide) pyrophosphoryl-undecaprenol N-acetylglucosamine transferase [Phycisphaerales bacterium]|nr:MAG: UDP-N-acetylglucosamine--N-acetylmuramyl-(pentapeptide) pyrophosphoryl-undecaprenol N-acetylglucosamine transferase [Phycisphaerales bacterium]
MVSHTPTATHDQTIVFAGGGTGGHLYPALAIADAFRGLLRQVRFVFFVSQRAIDGRILDGTGCELMRQSLLPLSGIPWRWPRILASFRRSSLLCRSRISASRVAVVIGTGGFTSVPAVCEARRVGIPTVLLNPDAIPGKANRLLASIADRVFVQWEDTLARLPRRASAEVLGCAIRPDFLNPHRTKGLERFGLDPQLQTLLVTGASQGARTVNEAVIANLSYLQLRDDWQVLHLTGEQDFEKVDSAYRGTSIRACVMRFTGHMADALAAADLVVSRAGASTLAEITAVGVPAVLMPYPYHKDMHQLANARCLERTNAAKIVHDAVDPVVNGPALRHALEPLMTDSEHRAAMASAARGIGHPRAAERIAREIVSLAGERGVLLHSHSVEESCESAR